MLKPRKQVRPVGEATVFLFPAGGKRLSLLSKLLLLFPPSPGEVPFNHEILREAYALCHCLPVLSTDKFKTDFYDVSVLARKTCLLLAECGKTCQTGAGERNPLLMGGRDGAGMLSFASTSPAKVLPSGLGGSCISQRPPQKEKVGNAPANLSFSGIARG